ncbi:MAG: pyridoxal phosphate-dependent aminotransferase family protein [bacterium]|nr:pyridoxal phosphate-dependent aminotransferase family protein [bacterium]
MAKKQFYATLRKELARIDQVGTTKRHERVIERFTNDVPPQAVIDGNPRVIFNSNDYLGLRFHPKLREAEEDASRIYGTGPGAVRFISGTLQIYKNLEQAIAKFHGRDDALVISSAFAANVGVISSLIKGQSKDSVVSGDTLVVSDELNHRSIIEGIRVAGLAPEQKAIFKHMNPQDLGRILKENKGKFDRVVVVTDGVFSMLGECQNLLDLRRIIDKYDLSYKEGVILLVDDAHGVGCFGKTGRGAEDVCGAKADVLVGTLGKGFGADGGYVTGDQVVMDYLRESVATYIYSNSISPGTAGAGLAALKILQSREGTKLLTRLKANISLFKKVMKAAGFKFAADSNHPIQPLLIGNTEITKKLTIGLFNEGYLVTNINYPVVPAGRDEIRIQISAAHTEKGIEDFVSTLQKVAKRVGFKELPG